MKRFKPVTLKAKFIDRKGSRNIKIPLNLNVGSARSRSAPANLANSASSDVSLSDRVDQVIFQEDTVSSHEIRRIRELKKWSGLRELLVNVAVEESCLLPGTICMHCQQTEATVRCNDCGPRQFFCLECSKSLHKTRNIFHILQLWTVS